MPAQLIARDLEFAHGPHPVLAGVSVQLAPGECTGIVGPNGVGKTTLLRLLAGELHPAAGTVECLPPDATVGLLRQELDALDDETVRDLIARRTGVATADIALDEATQALGGDDPDATDHYTACLDRWMRLGGEDLAARTGETLARVGLDLHHADQAVATLSGGERARVALAALLLSRFDVLLLDEPTNDLDLAGLAQLEEFVAATSAAVAVVSHDRRFLERVVTTVLEIDEHQRTGTEFGGGWNAYLELRATERRHAEERFATYTDQKDRLTSRARRERDWATQGVKKERSPRDNDKAQRDFRINRTEQLASRARRTEKAIDRLDAVDKPWEGWDLRFTIASAGRGGDVVADLSNAVVERTSDHGTFRMGPVTLTVAAGERVAIVGPNGAGKSTLLAALLGDIELTSGTRRIGPSVVVGRLDQARERFSEGDTLLRAFLDDLGVTPEEARSTLAKFGLGAEHVNRATDALSPGERTRAVLAAFQLQQVNLLVLDEPTNHLDLPAIEQLESALDTFEGTILVVSHDRAFLDALRFTREIEVDAGQLTDDSPR